VYNEACATASAGKHKKAQEKGLSMPKRISIPADVIIVDRNSFQAYASGILLDRDKQGRVLIGDTVENHEALAALERGETIYLSVNRQIVSEMREVADVFEERCISEIEYEQK
jgi:hypothetical protein